MSKMDALNQQTVIRFLNAIKDYDSGLLDQTEFIGRTRYIQGDYFEDMIRIMEEIKIEP